MKQSKGGASFVHCNFCGNDFSIASGGLHEVKQHVATERHTELAKGGGCTEHVGGGGGCSAKMS